MRKLVILAGLLLAATLVPGAPARADIGCQCVKLGVSSACVANMLECNTKVGGLCVAPCAYTPAPPKAAKRHAVKRHHAAKHSVAKKAAPKKKAKKM
jgi:hypothetical protein